eukprot:6939743-Pyramimonas_sp.AAC.1
MVIFLGAPGVISLLVGRARGARGVVPQFPGNSGLEAPLPQAPQAAELRAFTSACQWANRPGELPLDGQSCAVFTIYL